MKVPHVIRLVNYVHVPRSVVKFSRRNVSRPRPVHMSILSWRVPSRATHHGPCDTPLPGRRNNMENVVTACKRVITKRAVKCSTKRDLNCNVNRNTLNSDLFATQSPLSRMPPVVEKIPVYQLNHARSEKLKKRWEFQRAYQKGSKYWNRYFVIYVFHNHCNNLRLGITASRKSEKAFSGIGSNGSFGSVSAVTPTHKD